MNSRKLYRWIKRESKKWGRVNRHFRENVVMFSRGAGLACSSQLRKIAGCVAGNAESNRRRLQRFVNREVDLAGFFAEWSGTLVKAVQQQEVVLVVDETKLKDRQSVMLVGLVYGGRCLPMAWRVYPANCAADYPSEGQVDMILQLLGHVQTGLGRMVQVRVLVDRGIGTSPALMRGIIDMGWTFLFRVTRMSKLVVEDGTDVTFYDQVQQPGQTYAASGFVFKRRGLVPAHVRVLWGQHAKDKWALVTNDPTLSGWEYAQRMWIEEAFRDLKSFGFQLESAALDSSRRLAYLLVFLAVAYTWLIFWGASLGASAPTKKAKNGSRVRRWSLFRLGRQAFLLSCPFF